jgi:hypothetical protein
VTREQLLEELLIERYGVKATPTPPHMPVTRRQPVDELALYRQRKANTTTDHGRTATA